MGRNFIKHLNNLVPIIGGAKGGGKGGGGGGASEDPNSLFSTDILFVTSALGEGPVYRINPNGPQDIEIQDSSVDDLIDFATNTEDTDKFKTLSATGTTTQAPLTVFGETIVTPQTFASPVSLKKGDIAGVPSSKVTDQETSANSWDAIKFNFLINGLRKVETNGDVKVHTISFKITLKNKVLTGNPFNDEIATFERTITGKTGTPFKFNVRVNVPDASKSDEGYRFTIEKTSGDDDSAGTAEDLKVVGWSEIENSPQAYPRTALIGYALKAVDEHQNGVPNFTSMVKGLLVKVPSNYNQPTLANGEIDWRHVEVAKATRAGQGYYLQASGTTKQTAQNPQIYVGTWDGTFVYSWTQNPVWIVYDILTNTTYGLGIPEEHIDKYKFYQVAQYCDACDSVTGNFNGVPGLADGSFRHKPLDQFTATRETLVGLAAGTAIEERRFTLNVSIADESQTMDLLNSLCSSFRAALVYSSGKLTMAADMPDEFPVAVFNETNIKQGSFQISGSKESEVISGVDVSYVEPTNHYKRETVRIDSADANDGVERNVIQNLQSLDLAGVTRRSQALRFAQYQIAASKYQRRTVTFSTSTDALNLAPGDVISVAQQGTGIAYGYSGKVSETSNTSQAGNTNVFLEHFTVPTLSNSLFTANSGPLALRIIKMKDDRVDLYLISNTAFALTKTDNVSTGFDFATVNGIQRFDYDSKAFTSLSSWTTTLAPEKGDLWSLGEIENPNDFYTNKAGKLFKITGLERDPDEEAVTISAIEYISNVYVDSDTFIDYTPTAYTDIISPLSAPPPPVFNFIAAPRRRIDGSVRVDGILEFRNEGLGYGQDLQTEFFISRPDATSLVSNVTGQSPLTLTVSNSSVVADSPERATLLGKNGYESSIGSIRLLCNAVNTVDTGGGIVDGNVELTLEGFNVAFDENFFKHVLDVNDDPAVFGNLKGTDYISIPIKEKTSAQGLLNFIGFAPQITELAVNIADHDIVNNTVKFENTLNNGLNLVDILPTAPFYVTINQLLDSRYYNNNSFYVSGSEFTYLKKGNLDSGTTTHIDLEVEPRHPSFVRFFVDGIEKSSGQFTVNRNDTLQRDANIVYTKGVGETTFRAEVDHYTVPIIEVGDNVQAAFNNTFSVINSSFDPASATYNAALTANSIYRIELAEAPKANLSGFSFVNISPNPIGAVANVSGNSFTLDFTATSFPGSVNLANNRVYDLEIGGEFEKLFVSQDQVIPDLPVGTTTVRSRNKNIMGRRSAFVTKSVTVDNIPIQKVTGLGISESLYREQTGGVAVRATISFSHIQGQEVTDYEISYSLDNVDDIGSDDGGADLTSFNTVKVPASGVDTDGKIRFTVSGINRGTTSETNSITFKITPLNKSIRGATATISKSIVGKTATPANIFNFTGGQNTDQITLLWTYPRAASGDLLDLDLKEVVIRRAPGNVSGTIENFVASDPLVTVSAGTARKSIPIDTFGEFTYLARTRDTSGNFSEDVASISFTTTRPERSTIVAAYNEDAPGTDFTDITNTNSGEENFPSFTTANNGGINTSAKADGFPSSLVDNANGSSSGFSAIGGSPTDLLAAGSGEYITQVRDFGSTVTGSVFVDIEATQEVQTTYNDTKEDILSGVTEASPNSNVLKDVDFGGIGHVLGFNNTNISDVRFDANNQTLMSGGINGNVYAIWNDGQYTDDESNANSYALIAGVIDQNQIELGASYFANGEPTGSNGFSNITVSGNSYKLVNFTQYSDTGSGETFAGTLGAVTSQVQIRTTTADNTTLYYSNGQLDESQFVGGSINKGFVTYQAGSRSLRQFQLKFIVNNSKPNEFDFTIDKFRYSIEKDTVNFTETVTYDGAPKTVSLLGGNFINRPVITYAVLTQEDAVANPAIVVTTAASNQEVSFKLVASDGTGEYLANSTATVMVSAIGV